MIVLCVKSVICFYYIQIPFKIIIMKEFFGSLWRNLAQPWYHHLSFCNNTDKDWWFLSRRWFRETAYMRCYQGLLWTLTYLSEVFSYCQFLSHYCKKNVFFLLQNNNNWNNSPWKKFNLISCHSMEMDNFSVDCIFGICFNMVIKKITQCLHKPIKHFSENQLP